MLGRLSLFFVGKGLVHAYIIIAYNRNTRKIYSVAKSARAHYPRRVRYDKSTIAFIARRFMYSAAILLYKFVVEKWMNGSSSMTF